MTPITPETDMKLSYRGSVPAIIALLAVIAAPAAAGTVKTD